jgi:hypothetical protein
MIFQIVISLAAWLMFMESSALAADAMIARRFAELSLLEPTPSRIVICHGFDCRLRAEVGLTGGDRAQLAAILRSGQGSPAAERRSVARAIAWFDRRVGPAAGTTHRVARASFAQSSPGQMDCIDTSSNTTSMLLILEELHLLRHHRVSAPVARGTILSPHATGVLAESKTGIEWAVDTWTHNYGEQPDVKPLDVWKSEH